MRGINPIIISKEKARKEYKKYLEILKERKEQHLQDLKKLYYHLKDNHKIIDVYEALRFVGLNNKQEPRLAIVRADAKLCYFHKEDNNKGFFSFDDYNSHSYKFNVNLPSNIFKINWKRDRWSIKNRSLQTKVPIVPANCMPKGNLKEYYLLWEVDKWENIPNDPILLKRITKNLFAIIKTWKLSKLEKALIAGR